MATKNNLQVPMPSSLKKQAESVGQAQGFSAFSDDELMLAHLRKR